jgi:hypothetical protein
MRSMSSSLELSSHAHRQQNVSVLVCGDPEVNWAEQNRGTTAAAPIFLHIATNQVSILRLVDKVHG